MKMRYDSRATLKEFDELMVNIRGKIPGPYAAFMKEKKAVICSGKLPEKTKWLLLLTAGVSQKCPVCIPRAVQHCLGSGWKEEEILEACMVAVLVGGSSVMTYVTLVEKAIEEFEGKK